MLQARPLEQRIDEEGVLDSKMTAKEIRRAIEDATGEEVKTPSSSALAASLDTYEPGVYHKTSDKRVREALGE